MKLYYSPSERKLITINIGKFIGNRFIPNSAEYPSYINLVLMRAIQGSK